MVGRLSGKPLFPRRVLHPTLRLMAARPMGSGMVELRNEVERATRAGGP